MIFSHLVQKSPAKAAAIARLLLVAGLLLLVSGIAWPRLPFLAAHLSQQWFDFWNGFLFGLGLTLELGAVIFLRIVRRHSSQATL